MNDGKPMAALYRMAMREHTCPYGMKSRDLLRRKGYRVEDHLLSSRAEVDAFKAQHQVKTTPQIFMEGNRIGGYEDLKRHLGMSKSTVLSTYWPVIAVFLVAAAMAIAASVATESLGLRTLQWFVAFSMCLLALLKLQDVERFSSMFLGYDLLARRWIRYGYIYPFAEFTAGALMISGRLTLLSAPLALFIGGIGAVSVIKAVYIEKRDIKCACVGGNSTVPLGTVSLIENVMMVFMAIVMLTN
jgi:glutaredoxin